MLLCINPTFLYSQNSKIVTATCGKCGNKVSPNSKIGDMCPHCKAIWGDEKTSKTSSSITQNKIITNRNSTSNSTYEESLYERTITIRDSNLRSSPNINSQKICTIPKEEEIILTKKNGDWYRIEYLGASVEEINDYKSYLSMVELKEKYPDLKMEMPALRVLPTKKYFGWIRKDNIVE